jgi:hypothetical protein
MATTNLTLIGIATNSQIATMAYDLKTGSRLR